MDPFWYDRKDSRRFIPVHSIISTVGLPVSHIFWYAHALTGSDTTSAVFKIGKKSLCKFIKTHANRFTDLGCLGRDDSDKAFDTSRKKSNHNQGSNG